MTENRESGIDAVAVIEKRSPFSIVWVVPVAAAVIGGLLLYRTLTEARIPITLRFETAEGLEAEKTKIKFKDVEMGVVDTIRVSDDMEHVVLGCSVDRHAAAYLKDGTRFWVVRPRISTEGISGLGTLLSGSYIALQPGEGRSTRTFRGLEAPPVLDVNAPGRQYELEASALGSVGAGSPIYYRGIRVGEVLSHELDDKARHVTMKIFVNAPHHVLVFKETQFWNASGLDVRMGADGMSVKTASLEAMLIGGVQFETPERVTNPSPAPAGTAFELHDRYDDIDRYYRTKRRIVAYFTGSVRGLQVGAPVEFKGMNLGEVEAIDLDLDLDSGEFRIPVTLRIEPERILESPAATDEEAAQNMRLLVERGLRAQLKTGSLLTGQLFVDLVLEPDSPVVLRGGADARFPEVPTIGAPGLAAIERSLVGVLKKIEALPLDRLISSAADTAEGLSRIVNSSEVADTIKVATATLTDVRAAIDQLARDADGTTDDVRKVLASADAALGNLNGMLGPDSAMRFELARTLKELSAAARSLRALAGYLERHPEALIQGKGGK